MKALDLFSGIGGVTWALRGLVDTVAFCEIDPFTTEVLHARMADGSLPAAPICADVVRLDPTWLREHGVDPASLDIILAGPGGDSTPAACHRFPCQGFSTLGKKEGFEHAGSGLFRHILRLPQLLLL